MHETAAPAGVRDGLGRRELLIGAGAALAGLSITSPGRSLLNDLPFIGGSAAAFDRPEVAVRLGETFRIVQGAAAGTVLTLTDIVELPHAAAATDLRFAVRFTARSTADLAAGTYTFASRSFGEIPLFVSPTVASDGRRTGYEALIDRYVPAGQGARP